MKIKKGVVGLGVAGALLMSLSVQSVLAEGPVISGYVDTQYNYNFDMPKSRTTALRSYDATDNNISNTAHLALTGELDGNVGYTVELDAGSDAPTTAGTVGESVVLQEAYLTWAASNGFGFKAGKFATYQGIEVIENPDNPTITRGYLYGLAEPFTHVGAVATYGMEKVDFAFGVVNGWDLPTDNNPGKTLVAKVGFDFGDPLSFSISGYHGPEQAAIADNAATPAVDETDSRSGVNRDSIDLTGMTKLIPMVDLYFQANYGTESQVLDLDGDSIVDDRGSWAGFTVQPVINFTEKFSIGGRFEYFDDDGSRTGTTDTVVRNVTITPGYKLTENVTLRAEVRMDESNRKVFQDDKGVADDSTTSGALQFVLTY